MGNIHSKQHGRKNKKEKKLNKKQKKLEQSKEFGDVNSHKEIPSVDYSLTKSKWELNMDQMIVVGKYFNSNKQYVNVMKVNKKYQELVEKYEVYPLIDYWPTKEKW